MLLHTQALATFDFAIAMQQTQREQCNHDCKKFRYRPPLGNFHRTMSRLAFLYGHDLLYIALPNARNPCFNIV